ncbi:glutathione hydrolase 1 [Aplysia californica]|uniref:Glutathione hydrolase 1 n=1 Tax=Aplysia californica TaxID=6500 RepID=A0ABM0K9J0_APLCA|nr:glutathione hydrolase 1 [Aplysia californica]
MDSIEQPFDSITRIGQEVPNTSDKAELIEDQRDRQKNVRNGDSPGAENSPLHQSKSTNSLLHGPQNQGLRVIIISSVVFAVAVTVALILTIYLEPKQVHGHAAVACDDVRCSRVGLQVLRDGGNSVDAAVAAAFCQGVVSPAHSGLGGGGFALVHDHKFKKSSAYDFRETAPNGITPDMLSSASESDILTTGVPGQLKGLAAMHRAHGKLPWKDVVEPAITLAEQFYVSEALVKDVFHKLNKADLSTSLRGVLLLNGEFKTMEDNITLPGMVATLRAIQADPDALYSGRLREPFVKQMREQGGIITEEDLKNYTVSFPSVISSTFKELTVVGLPPPSGAAVVGMILNVVEKLGWKQDWYGDALMYHQLVEAFKFAFAQKGLLEDAAFNAKMEATVAYMLSEGLAKELAEKIKGDNKTHSDPSYYGPSVPPNDKGTTHLSVIDSAELMVSVTLSLNSLFGNQYLLPSGIILNNQLMDFNLNGTAQDVNNLEPGKRPQSSMSPLVLYNDDHPCAHRLVIGASNGTRIITGLAETIVNSVLFDMNITGAILAPRVHNQLSESTEYESGIPQMVVKEMEDMGHTMVRAVEGLSCVQGIDKTNDDLAAFSDPRKYGQAAEY